MKINRILFGALLDTVCFLEFSDESVVQLDAAVRELEEVAYILQRMDPEEKSEVAKLCKEMATEYSSDPKVVEFISNLPETMGFSA